MNTLENFKQKVNEYDNKRRKFYEISSEFGNNVIENYKEILKDVKDKETLFDALKIFHEVPLHCENENVTNDIEEFVNSFLVKHFAIFPMISRGDNNIDYLEIHISGKIKWFQGKCYICCNTYQSRVLFDDIIFFETEEDKNLFLELKE